MKANELKTEIQAVLDGLRTGRYEQVAVCVSHPAKVDTPQDQAIDVRFPSLMQVLQRAADEKFEGETNIEAACDAVAYATDDEDLEDQVDSGPGNYEWAITIRATR